MTVSRMQRERLIAYAVLALGIALIVVAHWPGRLDPDSMATINQLRSGFIGDHRAAVLTWIWQQGYLAVDAGPGVLLLLQTAGLGAGCYLVLRSTYRRVAAAALAVAILFAPPTFGFVALVGRDMWFVAPCLLAVGIAVALARSRPDTRAGALSWLALAGAAALGALAVASRLNGAAAVAPVMVALAAVGLMLLARGRRAPRGARTRPLLAASLIGLAATVVAVAGTLAATAAIRTHHEYPEVYTQLWDLGYLTGKYDVRFIPELPRGMQPAQTIAEVERRWRPITSLYMRWDDRYRVVPDAYTATAAEQLAHAWRTAIREHPLAYLEGRFELWTRQLGIGHTPVYSMVVANAANPFGLDGPRFPALSDAAVGYASFWATGERLRGGLVHHAWPYLLVCIAGLVLLLPRFPPQVRLMGVLGAAGVGMQLGLFFLAPSVQWRYELLTVYAAILLALVSGALAVRARRDRPRRAPEARQQEAAPPA
ncbi:MAG TPA: hypothetical protein VK506_04310 [Conexibacter sp.]|nr:hypothetical protein [Conexibacter sp.]